MSLSSYWPSMVDYQEAVQSPPSAFTSSELRSGTPVANKLGMPRPISGTFASVYELASGGRRWAVKCFLRNIPGLHQRYAKISDHLKKCRLLRYFATFEYQDKGILVRGKSFPLVKMEWVEGYQLNTFIEQNLSRRRVLAKLKKTWVKLLADLRSAHIAHGDLQHGNVLVRPNGDLRLIDYDGMWVPALAGEESNETGHPDYQNPRRTQKDFHAGVDEFSDAVIQIAICALARERSLWDKYNNGDNLLFRRRDFLDPQSSPLIADLQALGDPEIKEKLEFVLKACARRKKAPGKKPAAPRPAAPAAWLSDYVEDYQKTPESVSSLQSSRPGGAPKSAKDSTEPADGAGFLRSLLRSLFGP
jgi:serine/threonine protein kinase